MNINDRIIYQGEDLISENPDDEYFLPRAAEGTVVGGFGSNLLVDWDLGFCLSVPQVDVDVIPSR